MPQGCSWPSHASPNVGLQRGARVMCHWPDMGHATCTGKRLQADRKGQEGAQALCLGVVDGVAAAAAVAAVFEQEVAFYKIFGRFIADGL